MMDKIRALDDETFYKLREALRTDDMRRRNRLFRKNKQATFNSTKTGEVIRLMIISTGSKNVVGYRIHDDGRHDMSAKWRVSISCLSPYFEPLKVKASDFKPGAADIPMTQATF